MLWSMKELQGMTIRAADGEMGRVSEFYFDDRRWVVRYLVADTRGELGRLVLVSPISVAGIERENERIDLILSREQVKNSPSVDLHRPISRQYETEFSAYYGYLPYWTGAGYWGLGAAPGALAGAQAMAAEASRRRTEAAQEHVEPHLHASAEVFGYHIKASDGEIGHIDDFILDVETWAIRYMHVDTSNFIGGKDVLVAASFLDAVNWHDRTIAVKVTRDAVKGSPEYDRARLDRDFEHRLYRHYGERPYWE